jgi:imidazolonepropionase-like amidohydrolase
VIYIIICADLLLTGDKHIVYKNGAVCVQNGLIQSVGKKETVVGDYPDEEIMCYEGASLIPGMIDLHTHIGMTGNPVYMNEYNGIALQALYAANRMADTLKAGVTTIRDCCSAYGIATALKTAREDGLLSAPRIFACLKGLCMTGGHGSGGDAITEVDGALDIIKAIRLNKKRGADCIKVLTSEGYRGEEMNDEELETAVREAHRLGMKIAAHAGYGNSINQCIAAGFDSIEHGTHLTIPQAVTMREHNQTWVPTIFIFNHAYQSVCKESGSMGPVLQRNKDYLADSVSAYENNFRALYDTGVRIATGTDTDCVDYKGASPVWAECDAMVKCGLTPLEAIECATKNGAEALGIGNAAG